MYNQNELKRILHILSVYAFHQYDGNKFSKYLSLKYTCDTDESEFVTSCVIIIYMDKISIKYNAPAVVNSGKVISTDCELYIPVDADKLIDELRVFLKNIYTTTAYQPTEIPHGYPANTLMEIVTKTMSRDKHIK